MNDTFDSDSESTDFRGDIVNAGNSLCVNETILNKMRDLLGLFFR